MLKLAGNSDLTTDAQLKQLKWALEMAKESIEEAPADKRGPLLAQYRAILAEIAGLEDSSPARTKGKVNGLVILQEELAKREQSGTKGARRTGTRNV